MNLCWSAVATLAAVAAVWGLTSLIEIAHQETVTGTALEMQTGRKAVAQMCRAGSSMNIELLYFPSFESTFSQPEVSRDSGGRTVVSLQSYSPGPFHRKSEQLTNLTFTLPGAMFRKGELVLFRSVDYEEVITSVVAP
jgi:hypothetical protein